ncbi:hypothetical protein BGX38DRAFT_1153250 [Terfezia claveryi]|nr:hypothetical protein BGX38DRAFT_1153250 [Terfezia claveryi]
MFHLGQFVHLNTLSVHSRSAKSCVLEHQSFGCNRVSATKSGTTQYSVPAVENHYLETKIFC